MSLEDEIALWERQLPGEITTDPIWTCTAYRLATFLADRAGDDLNRLASSPRTRHVADHLARALDGIGATYTEGYSRRSARDRCRYYEYALGSAREARDWTFKARHVLGEVRTRETLMLLARIIRLLTTTVVNERARNGRAGSQFDG